MSRPKLNEEQIAKLQGQIAITKDGKRYIFNSAKEALEYIRKNTPEGYNVYDTTSYTRNYDPKIKPTVPLISKQEWVDNFNETRVKPLNEILHIKYPERSFQNAFVDERGYIHVPTMAGRKRKEGGKLIKINKNGIN